MDTGWPGCSGAAQKGGGLGKPALLPSSPAPWPKPPRVGILTGPPMAWQTAPPLPQGQRALGVQLVGQKDHWLAVSAQGLHQSCEHPEAGACWEGQKLAWLSKGQGSRVRTTRRQGPERGSPPWPVTCDLLLDLALHRPQSSHLYNEGADLEGDPHPRGPL